MHIFLMVARRRFSRFAAIAVAYIMAMASVGYFIFQAQHGERGLETRKALRAELRRVNDELKTLKSERFVWDRRVAQLQAPAVDKDLLDERSRRIVNRVHRDDVVIHDSATE
jgi:cell division protein FtsB